MTPLLQEIVRDTLKPVKKRSFADPVGMLKLLDDVHCFEVTAVLPAMEHLALDFAKNGGAGLDSLAFLPSKPTWIEWGASLRSRIGFLLVDRGPHADVYATTTDRSYLLGMLGLQDWFKYRSDSSSMAVAGDGKALPLSHAKKRGILTNLHAALAMINTPRIVGRTTHMPHAGFQRDLARAKGMTGKFPLQAWTEIKLEIGAPKEATGESEEIRLSGEKALHFVRAHLRIRRGQLELVSAHWRGNPANGIKQSRYAVVPSKDGIAA